MMKTYRRNSKVSLESGMDISQASLESKSGDYVAGVAVLLIEDHSENKQGHF